MALVPNSYTEQTLDEYDAPEEFAEAVGSVTVVCGWYKSPAFDEPILLEKTTTVRNHVGHVNRRDEEQWFYNRAGAPPTEYHRDTYGRAYLPGSGYGYTFGSAPVLLERVREVFHPWTLFQPGAANLSRRRSVAGFVVYDLRAVDKPLEAEEVEELEARDRNPEGPGDIIVDSARPWHQAIKLGEIIRDPDAPQRAIWRNPYESETELVFEEPDRFSVFTVRKDHLRDGPAEVDGPDYQKKDDFVYSLPVDIDPPDLAAKNAADVGIRLEVRGGGADLDPYVTPQRYRIERLTASEPARDTNPDPWELYEDGSAPASSRAVGIVETSATDYSGAPSSSTPEDSGHVEPGDDSEPEEEAWTVIVELENAAPPEDPGFAATIDGDVVSGGTYVYRAVAIIGAEESAPSSAVRVTYGGQSRSSSIRVRGRNVEGAAEVDALAPFDGELPPDYGEVVVFDEFPFEADDFDDALELGEEVARRQFAETRDSALELELETTEPLIILERGQLIQTPAVAWSTTGNGLVLTTETEARAWRLDGFRFHVRRSGDGLDAGTVLYLTE